jgi:RNA polymerase sigma factor (sigma-70 family)
MRIPGYWGIAEIADPVLLDATDRASSASFTCGRLMIRTGVEKPGSVQGGRLGQLYVRHGPSAVRFAYLLTGDHSLAEDLVQEAFVRLAGRFQDLRNPDSFDAYLRKTVVNLTRTHFRHRSVERAYLKRQPVPSDAAVARDVAEYESIKEALLRLPERQRAAIVLRYLRGPVGTPDRGGPPLPPGHRQVAAVTWRRGPSVSGER